MFKYSIGLDIGTNSVGWAVIDPENNLLKYRGKNMWGVRLFSEGKTAAERRGFRATRRRIHRRRQRIGFLQELLAEDVFKKDQNFYLKLKESFVVNHGEEKKYNFFDDDNFTDQTFYKQYPTIYHLRNKLISDPEQVDIRLVYLALHHIIKYRGHFLFEGQTFNIQNTSITKELDNLLTYLKDNFSYDIEYSSNVLTEIETQLFNPDIAKREKEKLGNLIYTDNISKKIITQIFKGILGYKFDLAVICDIVDDENKEDYKISLNSELNEVLIESNLGEHFEVFTVLKNIYSSLVLREILGIEEENSASYSISSSMIKRYDDFKNDLKILKRLIKLHYPNKYNEIFRDVNNDKVHNFHNYMNQPGKSSQEEFYKYLKKILEVKQDLLAEDPDYIHCMNRINNEIFLLRQRVKLNSAIPYQIHKEELISILDNQGKYYPSIEQNKDKIISLLEFRIPYYVGPLNFNPNDNKFAWIERKQENRKIYPWNFEEVVDIDKSAEKFILRMTNKCTYLPDEDVLPKFSLINMEFNVLDELNKIKVNGGLLPLEVKKEIINECFLTKNTVKENHIIQILKKNPIYNTGEIIIEGYRKDKQFAGSLTSHRDFNKIFGKIDESNRDMIEEIIKWITLFEDKRILTRKIKDSYPEITSQQLKCITALKYSGWSRLSKKLLDGITTPDKGGFASTILDIMYKTNYNFMQIINSDEYCFKTEIEKLQEQKTKDKITIHDVQELPGSPALKKAVWQAIKIVNEIIKVMKCKPVNIYLENTRSDGKPGRTKPRGKWLKEQYQLLKEETNIYNKEVNQELNHFSETIKNDRLFLYFIQHGKCMYSGKELDINRLHEYEVDHILPQSLIKDDSIDNRVLVLKEYNQLKADRDTLPRNIINNMEPYWNKLLTAKLISNKKYYNLCRTRFREEDIAGFINRQFVETSQIVKNVVNLLNTVYKGTKIHTLKPILVSNFRSQLSLYKNRDVNDFHHAHDAYLTACLNNFISIRYPKISSDFLYGEYRKNPKNTRKNRHGFIINAFMNDYIDEHGELIWDAQKQISKIKKAYNYKDCFISKRVEESTGAFYNQTIEKRGKAIIPLRKDLDPQLYGGYTNVNIAYLVAFEFQKGKRIRKLLAGVPILYASKFKKDPKALIAYLKEQHDADIVNIIKPKILINQLIDFDGHLVYLASTRELNNATQLILNYEYDELVYLIFKNTLEENPTNNEKLVDFYEFFIEKLQKHYPIYENIAIRLKDGLGDFEKLTFEEKCQFIKEILKVTQANATNANLKKYNVGYLKDRVGRITKTVDLDKTIFIAQSVTGLYEKRYRL